MFKKEGVGVKSIKCQQNEIEIMRLSGSALALHSFQKDFFFFFLSTYYRTGTLAFILSERQERLRNSEGRSYMI